ncbi:NAD(P)/FAD-dependent oxidoreductase [Salisediminibacterium beveridgei]|uniref:NADH dehydrogenase n=1 Tax=Salisediminibacterium beveridgei TaxID=632773 RepID=A0A1D7QSQ8_9BACI|nr:NAD(P)/FAD-dependent oxidoreductase [Salisediminibacterium beveridgei]AOM82032.1 NADH dehydrogenase [Salisediminibacterium beveridgei]
MKQLVILGGGYGGLRATQKLLDEKAVKDLSILLIEKEPYHSLKTEFYALAAGTVSDQELRVHFPNDIRLELKFAKIESVDLKEKKIQLENEEMVNYDDLIIGLGCEDRYHGVPGADQHTLSIQSMRRARKTYHVLQSIKANGRVAIVGGGLSGVELAAELRESRPDLEILLFDRNATILSSFPDKLSNYVTNWFEKHHVKLMTKANITEVERYRIFNHDEPIDVDATIWTAGIQASKIVRDLPVEQDNIGRLITTDYHHIPGDDSVFVVGDCAASEFAPSAQLAEAQAERIATLLATKWRGEAFPEKMPKIKLKGVLGSLGKKQGFGFMGEKPMTGVVPRVLKSGVLWMYKFGSNS